MSGLLEQRSTDPDIGRRTRERAPPVTLRSPVDARSRRVDGDARLAPCCSVGRRTPRLMRPPEAWRRLPARTHPPPTPRSDASTTDGRQPRLPPGTLTGPAPAARERRTGAPAGQRSIPSTLLYRQPQ